MTEPRGPAWRQTTFFPFAVTSRLARGHSLEVRVDAPTHDTAAHGPVPVVAAAATHDSATGASAVFLVNRSTSRPATVRIRTGRTAPFRASAVGIHDDDLAAVNSLHQQDRVGLVDNTTVTAHDDGTVEIVLPPVSWTAVEINEEQR